MDMNAAMRERLDYVLEKCFDEIRCSNESFRVYRNELTSTNTDEYEYERKRPRRYKTFGNGTINPKSILPPSLYGVFGKSFDPFVEPEEPEEESFTSYRITFCSNHNLKEDGVVELNKHQITINGSEHVRFESYETYAAYQDQLEEIFNLYETKKAHRAFDSVIKIMGYDRQYKLGNLTEDY